MRKLRRCAGGIDRHAANGIDRGVGRRRHCERQAVRHDVSPIFFRVSSVFHPWLRHLALGRKIVKLARPKAPIRKRGRRGVGLRECAGMAESRSRWRENGRNGLGARSCRPIVEQLEHRLAPAVFHVNTLQDTFAVNTATGQDATGQISLRSAVMAANVDAQTAHAPPDTIILPAGAFATSKGALPVRGELQIIGQGPAQTVIETIHRDRLFEVEGGNLLLDDLTLDGGSESTLVSGTVHLSNCVISDTDVAAVAAALMAPKEPAPTIHVAALQSAFNQQDAPLPIASSAGPARLLGPLGGGSRDQESLDAGSDAHQAFWRGDADPVHEQSTTEQPEEAKVRPAEKSVPEAAAPGLSEQKPEPIQQNLSPPLRKTALISNALLNMVVVPSTHINGSAQVLATLLAMSCGLQALG